MRTVTISAALSAGLIASHAMADQGNWVFAFSGSSEGDTVIVGDGFDICRAVGNPAGDKYPGTILHAEPAGCGISTNKNPVQYYDVLVPARRSASDSTIPGNATNKGAHGIGKFGLPGAPLYFCGADLTKLKFGKGVHPGSLDSKGCHIPYGGSTLTVTPYDVLVDSSPYRLPVTTANVSAGGNIPSDALVGGYDTDGQTLYYCQASYSGAVVPGKTGFKFKSCDIPWNGAEIYVPSYQVLVPLWKDSSVASFTFPEWTESNGAEIHICRDLGLYPGSYSPNRDPNKCILFTGTTIVKPFEILSE
jgi:hypothetical protein